MGTRADFYIKHDIEYEYLGSVGWDGYWWDENKDCNLMVSSTEKEFRWAVQKIALERNDFTHPDEEWPWPWENSNTTDFAYVFNGDKIDVYRFGRLNGRGSKKTDWPDMTDKTNVQYGKKSGLIIIGVK